LGSLSDIVGKTLEEVEEMFVAKIPAWKTHPEFNRAKAFEHGDLDPEKVAYKLRQSIVSEKDAADATATTTETAK